MQRISERVLAEALCGRVRSCRVPHAGCVLVGLSGVEWGGYGNAVFLLCVGHAATGRPQVGGQQIDARVVVARLF